MANRLGGVSGAFIGGVFTVAVGLLARPYDCFHDGVCYSPAPIQEKLQAGLEIEWYEMPWLPWIDSGGAATGGAGGEEDRWRRPMLTDAPLPQNYDPRVARRPVIGSILVAPDGRVLKARLPAGTGRRATDRAMVGRMEREWHVTLPPATPTWLRVRLSEPEYPPPPPPREPTLRPI